MALSLHERERKFVPRFRRKNQNKNLVDIDDEEAQALIDQDLKSNFKWTSDTTECVTYKYDDFEIDHKNNQQISINDQDNENYLYDIENQAEELWKNNIEYDNDQSIQWIDDNIEHKIKFSIENNQDKQQIWTLNDDKHKSIQLTLMSQDDEKYKHDLETNNKNSTKNFIAGDEFRNKIKFAIESKDENLNIFLKDNENDILKSNIDPNIPSIDSKLSLPQKPILIKWIEGISQYHLSLPVENYSQEYSPLTDIKIEIDSKNLKPLQWSLDLLKDNLIITYVISLPEYKSEQYSFPDKFNLKLSIDDQYSKQLFSLIDLSFKQTLSISTNDIKNQLLSLIDSFEIKQYFGNDDSYDNDLFKYQKYSLENLKFILLNLSPTEILNLIYSPIDVKQISFENILIESDEISARALRRYRCKHMSIKYDDKDQLDSLDGLKLEFKGNELIAIGEKQIENDFNQQQIYQDLTNSKILLEEKYIQIYDIKSIDKSLIHEGPCLYRSDYECEPPKTWSRLRREIGYISYDASISQPIYYFNKSYKRFVHIPENRDHCSYNVYKGYNEFIEKIKLNPDTYFRRFDSTDLRPLLNWYLNKQYLFSSANPNQLKPPTFICRRLVLRTILANLYYDSEPWKLLVIRIKGQFYLALANRQTKSPEDMTIDEYSGFKFESLFTSDQPNTTRLKETIPLENPQHQFHTVQYWQFGDFNLLYSNEIDGEINENIQLKPTNTQINENPKQEEEKTTTTIEENSQKSIDVDWGKEESNIDKENSNDILDEKLKEMQINENLQLIKTDENDIIERKKRNDNEIKSGYVEMKCTNKKIFYRDENKLQTLLWWAQMSLVNINTLMIGYKTSNDGLVNQIDIFSMDKLISKFLSKYDLRLKYCFSYLYSFLKLIEKTVIIDDPNTIHAFAYIPQPLEIDPSTGKPLQYDLPKLVPFRYTQINRSNQRHSNFMPQSYIDQIQRNSNIDENLLNNQIKTIEQEMKKRPGHRGRSSFLLNKDKLKKNNKEKF